MSGFSLTGYPLRIDGERQTSVVGIHISNTVGEVGMEHQTGEQVSIQVSLHARVGGSGGVVVAVHTVADFIAEAHGVAVFIKEIAVVFELSGEAPNILV